MPEQHQPGVPPARPEEPPVPPVSTRRAAIQAEQRHRPRPPRLHPGDFTGNHAADPPHHGPARHVASRPAANRPARRAEHRAAHREPRRRRKPRASLLWLIAGLGVVALVTGAVLTPGPVSDFVQRILPAPDYSGTGNGEQVLFSIKTGDSGDAIAEKLAAQGVVASYRAFYELLMKENPVPTFFPGDYRLQEKMSAQNALNTLLDPSSKADSKVVIPEGTWAKNVLEIIAKGTGVSLSDLKAAAADYKSYGLPAEATSIEGFLFPATYDFPPDWSARQIIQSLVDRQFQALDAAGVAPADRYRTILIASVIQREAGKVRDDYFKISRVISNRLDKNLFPTGLLSLDSTVHYGLGDDSVVTTTDAQRADASNPYNTYQNPGLPPGPISNPGDLAIQAALHPADGPWLYFVTVNLSSGETVFSVTKEEHAAAVQRYLEWLKQHPEYGR